MATREVIGLGGVWERDAAFHDRCGLFRWKLEIKQAGKRIFTDFTPVAGNGDSWYDGWYTLSSSLQSNSIDWPCDNTGERIGKRVLVACVTTAKGQNANFTVTGTGTASGGSSGGSGGGSLAIAYAPGYAGQKLEWAVKLEICPDEEGCPAVKVIDNRASVSDSEYFWGSWLGAAPGNAWPARPHMPRVAVADCGVSFDPSADEVMPIDAAGPAQVFTAS
jgi:hypothetical protein